jgi:hypothetical protein
VREDTRTKGGAHTARTLSKHLRRQLRGSLTQPSHMEGLLPRPKLEPDSMPTLLSPEAPEQQPGPRHHQFLWFSCNPSNMTRKQSFAKAKRLSQGLIAQKQWKQPALSLSAASTLSCLIQQLLVQRPLPAALWVQRRNGRKGKKRTSISILSLQQN